VDVVVVLNDHVSHHLAQRDRILIIDAYFYDKVYELRTHSFCWFNLGDVGYQLLEVLLLFLDH
jgi:hypothetical protein